MTTHSSRREVRRALMRPSNSPHERAGQLGLGLPNFFLSRSSRNRATASAEADATTIQKWFKQVCAAGRHRRKEMRVDDSAGGAPAALIPASYCNGCWPGVLPEAR